MFERSATMSSRPSVILAMVRRALMMLVAALMIAIGSIVGLSPGVEASSMTAVEMRTSRVARDAALAVFAERQRVRDEPGYAKVIEFPHFAAAQAGRATSLPGRTTRRRDSVMAARDVAALDAGTSTYGYDFASRPTTASQFVATEAVPTVRHYTTSEAAESIIKGGEITPGSSGNIWVTPDRYVDGATAQSRLALSRTPDGYFEIPVCRVSCPSPPSRVEPWDGYPGGGIEITTTSPIDVTGLTFKTFGPR